jgi:ABC-type protease/lipase transport system fused ATPase/permease subunit
VVGAVVLVVLDVLDALNGAAADEAATGINVAIALTVSVQNPNRQMLERMGLLSAFRRRNFTGDSAVSGPIA